MTEEYQTPDHSPSPDRPERRGVGRKTVIEAAKDAVPTVDLADLLCGPGGLRRVGERWVGRCPLPDHKDRSPSFTVYPETNSWFCYGCLRGGDMIELARHAWGYEKLEAPMAAAHVLHEFGYEIPPRPAPWHAKQRRQQEIRNKLNDTKARTVQRRLFRLFEPYLSRIPDYAVRLEEAEAIYAELYPIARMVVDRMKAKSA